MSAKPTRPRTPPPEPTHTPAEQHAIRRARTLLLPPRITGPRSDDAYRDAATAAYVELQRPLRDHAPQPSAEPDPPIAAQLGAVPAWVSTGTTGMYPVLARRQLGLLEEHE